MEFDEPVEKVKRWKISKVLEHVMFLRKWYRTIYGIEEDEMDYTNSLDSKMPKVPRSIRSKIPRMGGYRGKTTSTLRGAGSHIYKFK